MDDCLQQFDHLQMGIQLPLKVNLPLCIWDYEYT